jgi:hypothetical protein
LTRVQSLSSQLTLNGASTRAEEDPLYGLLGPDDVDALYYTLVATLGDLASKKSRGDPPAQQQSGATEARLLAEGAHVAFLCGRPAHGVELAREALNALDREPCALGADLLRATILCVRAACVASSVRHERSDAPATAHLASTLAFLADCERDASTESRRLRESSFAASSQLSQAADTALLREFLGALTLLGVSMTVPVGEQSQGDCDRNASGIEMLRLVVGADAAGFSALAMARANEHLANALLATNEAIMATGLDALQLEHDAVTEGGSVVGRAREALRLQRNALSLHRVAASSGSRSVRAALSHAAAAKSLAESIAAFEPESLDEAFACSDESVDIQQSALAVAGSVSRAPEQKWQLLRELQVETLYDSGLLLVDNDAMRGKHFARGLERMLSAVALQRELVSAHAATALATGAKAGGVRAHHRAAESRRLTSELAELLANTAAALAASNDDRHHQHARALMDELERISQP